MLRERHPGIEALAFDIDPPSHSASCKENTYHGRAEAWTRVDKGGVDKLSRHQNSTLFLCYPPPDNNMALDALRRYSGGIVCYVGEYRGDTGTSKFEKLLDSTFQCIDIIPLPNWGDTCYQLTIWKRRTSHVSDAHAAKHPMMCSHCGRLKSKMYRCRLSYGVIFCSNECAAAGRERHVDELTYKYLLYNSSGMTLSECSSRKRKRGHSELQLSKDGPLFNINSQFFAAVKVNYPCT